MGQSVRSNNTCTMYIARIQTHLYGRLALGVFKIFIHLTFTNMVNNHFHLHLHLQIWLITIGYKGHSDVLL